MAPFIFGERGGVHIVDLEKTQAQLIRALEFVRQLGREGKVLLFVGTKKQAAPLLKKYAQDAGLPYVQNRWLGGTITNWVEIYRVIKKYNDLKDRQVKGELGKYTKKEQLDFSKEIERMSQLVGGIASLNKIPDALFIVDIKQEDTAVREANQKHVPIVALCDTNVNPEVAQYPIAGNDDAIKSVEMITRLIAEAYKAGKGERQTAEEAAKAMKEPKEAVAIS